MSEENLNQEERELEDIFEDETENSNDAEGEDSKDASLSADALQEYNKRVGKNYKSWDDVAKREKEADKAFAKGEHKKEEKTVPQSVDNEIVEELLLTKHPEAEFVMDELKKVAEQTGKSILKLFRESKYFQGEAKALADAKKSEEEAKSKIKAPSNGTSSSSKMDFSNVTEEDIVKMTPSQRSEFMRYQRERGR